MSSMGRLADAAQTFAGLTSGGPSRARTAIALELVAAITPNYDQSYEGRLRDACRAIVVNLGKTPTFQGQSALVESARNLRIAFGVTTSQANSAISDMVDTIRLFSNLLAEGVFAGSTALSLTNVATGAHDPAVVGGSGRGVNGIDILTLSGVPFVSALASDADVPTDLGVDYGVDLLSCTPTFEAAGTIVQVAIPYGWSTWANHPVSTTSRMVEGAGFTTQIIGAGANNTQYLAKSGESTVIMDSPVDAQPDAVSYDWVSGTSGARYGSAARQTFANTVTPTGALYVGNSSLTTKPFHGIIATWIINRVLTDAEYELMRVGLLAIAQGITLN